MKIALETGLRSLSRKSRMFLGTVGVGFFCRTPTLDIQLDHFLDHSPKLGIGVEMEQFLLKLLLKQRFLAVYHNFNLF